MWSWAIPTFNHGCIHHHFKLTIASTIITPSTSYQSGPMVDPNYDDPTKIPGPQAEPVIYAAAVKPKKGKKAGEWRGSVSECALLCSAVLSCVYMCVCVCVCVCVCACVLQLFLQPPRCNPTPFHVHYQQTPFLYFHHQWSARMFMRLWTLLNPREGLQQTNVRHIGHISATPKFDLVLSLSLSLSFSLSRSLSFSLARCLSLSPQTARRISL